MKKIILLAISLFSISVFALPLSLECYQIDLGDNGEKYDVVVEDNLMAILYSSDSNKMKVIYYDSADYY